MLRKLLFLLTMPIAAVSYSAVAPTFFFCRLYFICALVYIFALVSASAAPLLPSNFPPLPCLYPQGRYDPAITRCCLSFALELFHRVLALGCGDSRAVTGSSFGPANC
jgi:hypothetical protein